MAINVTLGEAKTQSEKPFPKLMISSNGKKHKNSIVFFTKYGCGVKLSGTCGILEGQYCTWWNMGSFTDYNEPITLQNA